MPTTTTTTPQIIDWPDLPDPVMPIREKTLFPAHRTDTEGGYIISRRRWTSPKRQWALEWDDKQSLLEPEYQTLEAFFLQKQGSSFTWRHPITEIVYTVTFVQDSMDSNIIFPGTEDGVIPAFRTARVEIRQV